MKNDPKNPSDMLLFDRGAVRMHRDRAAHLDWQKHGFLFEEVSDRLAERLLDVNRRFPTALDLGCHSGAFGSILENLQKVDMLVSSDLSGALMGMGGSGAQVVADEEYLPFAPASFDLIGSVLSLHWTNDLPGSLVQIARCLKPDGLFLGALFGVDSLHELKWSLMQAESEVRGGVSPRISPFAEIRDAGALLQRAGFALPVTDVDMLT
ncbi:MAG: methyltransferase domain-containing protein, partial [Sneathiella sp.]